MASLTEIKRKLQKVNSLTVIQGELHRIIVADSEIVQAKKDEFRAGELPSGGIIGEYASESYRAYKLKKNPLAGGNVDLILTGAFVNGLVIQKISADGYKFTSTDSKTPALQSKYGMQIWGLNRVTWMELQRDKYSSLLNIRLRQITGI